MSPLRSHQWPIMPAPIGADVHSPGPRYPEDLAASARLLETLLIARSGFVSHDLVESDTLSRIPDVMRLTNTLDTAHKLPSVTGVDLDDHGVIAILHTVQLIVAQHNDNHDVYDLDAFVTAHGDVYFVVVGADGYEDFPLELADAIAQDF